MAGPRPGLRLPALAALAQLGLGPCLAAALACEAPQAPVLGAAVNGIDARGDLTLSSGEGARLVGLRFPEPPGQWLDPASLDALLAPYRGLAPIAADPAARTDRWGRIPVWVASSSGNQADSLALALLREGLALTWPPELPPNCRILYLNAEAAARGSAKGRWSDMQNAVLEAADGAAVAMRAGQLALMQGRVMHVGQTRRAIYLNFGRRGEGASAELSLAIWREMEREGWTSASIRGRMVRIRGIVSEARPARLLVGAASALEKLD
ncbi:MAG: hypothetical protein HEQ16_00605 [Bosea sp.]|nr:hypothetical protein [Bosea sp. (in: a-proteobacteria)]